MCVLTPAQAGGANVCAFLDLIAYAEGTSRASGSASGLSTKNDGYDVIVRGPGAPEIFTCYDRHPFAPARPAKLIRVEPPLYSTASGRYQLMLRYWQPYRASLGLPDFGPLSQDRIAIQMLRECHAIAPIVAGDVSAALTLCSSRWASLPDNDYGQPGPGTVRLLRQWEVLNA